MMGKYFKFQKHVSSAIKLSINMHLNMFEHILKSCKRGDRIMCLVQQIPLEIAGKHSKFQSNLSRISKVIRKMPWNWTDIKETKRFLYSS